MEPLEEHGRGRRTRATQAANAQELSLERRRPGFHQAEHEPRGVQDRGSKRLDRVQTPHEHVRPRARCAA